MEEQGTEDGSTDGSTDGTGDGGAGPGTGTTGSGGRSGVALVVAGVALALVLALTTWWAGHERAPATGSFPEVEAAFAAAGLTVCASTTAPDPLAPGALASRTYTLAVRCADGTATVVVDRFASTAERDAAARRFEVLGRPRGSGVVYTLGDTTVSVQGSGDSDVQRALAPALQAAGAR
ncbi:MAG: hypothetical protein AB7J32_17765 [Pseudonocardia sp.]